MKKISLLLSCCLLACLTVTGQNNQPSGEQDQNNRRGSDNEVQTGFWTGKFAGGQIMVPLDRIVAVAKQKYILDGQFLVHELTLDVVGNTVTRVYYIEPLAATASGATNATSNAYDRARELGDMARERLGAGELDPETAVSKNYPTSTHSHTIEYRVRRVEDIDRMYRSLTTAISRGKGRNFTAGR